MVSIFPDDYFAKSPKPFNIVVSHGDKKMTDFFHISKIKPTIPRCKALNLMGLQPIFDC